MNNWNSKEKSALELINIAGTLWLDKNVELVILRRNIVDARYTEVLNNKEFAKKLKGYAPDFEIYLQFDSFENSVLQELRGADLNEIRKQAIENLNELNLSY